MSLILISRCTSSIIMQIAHLVPVNVSARVLMGKMQVVPNLTKLIRMREASKLVVRLAPYAQRDISSSKSRTQQDRFQHMVWFLQGQKEWLNRLLLFLSSVHTYQARSECSLDRKLSILLSRRFSWLRLPFHCIDQSFVKQDAFLALPWGK